MTCIATYGRATKNSFAGTHIQPRPSLVHIKVLHCGVRSLEVGPVSTLLPHLCQSHALISHGSNRQSGRKGRKQVAFFV